MTEDIKKALKQFILQEFLPGEDPEQLTEATPLITGGVLDSIAKGRSLIQLHASVTDRDGR